MARIKLREDVFDLSRRDGSHGGQRCWGDKMAVQTFLYMTQSHDFVDWSCGYADFQQNHMTLYFFEWRGQNYCNDTPLQKWKYLYQKWILRNINYISSKLRSKSILVNIFIILSNLFLLIQPSQSKSAKHCNSFVPHCELNMITNLCQENKAHHEHQK